MKRDPVRSLCPYCGVGCGVELVRDEQGALSVRGDRSHPANWGRLCGKGSALSETLGPRDRLLAPMLDGRPCAWDTALDRVAHEFSTAVRDHGPDSVAFYVSGQLLTEDYYVANKLMKGFIGAANIDTNSRLCMSSSVAGHTRAFGEDLVPGCYEDLDEARLVILAGSNAAWCHPVLYQRFMRRAQPPRVVVIDPRNTASTDASALHLPLRPGSDATLWNGLLVFLARSGHLDHGFMARATEGFEAAFAQAEEEAASVPVVAEKTGLAPAIVSEFYGTFASEPRVVTLYSQGINQSSSGTDKVNAIINCHLATGRIATPGAGPFSLTGQPNAMGGREVGGLANQLAAHMGFAPEDVERVGRFWGTSRIARKPGLKAVDLFSAMGRGEIKAVWIMATNPVDSLPDADRVRTALKQCPFVVVSDCVVRNDTTGLAHCLLPAQAWGEKDGTVTNSERRLSRQRRFQEPPGDCKPDWEIITAVARRMGFAEEFPYQRPADIFREHALLSGFENRGTRAFDISELSQLSDADYDRLTPVQWPIRQGAGVARLAPEHWRGRKGQFIAISARAPGHAPNQEYPLALNTGRARDHWHTMTRTGLSARLSRHETAPYVELHPDDARTSGIEDGALAEVVTAHGRVRLRARLVPGIRPGTIFVPIHWTDQYSGQARIGALVNPVCDPISGQPELKHTPARVTGVPSAWYALLLTTRALKPEMVHYWARAEERDCMRYELAGPPVSSGQPPTIGLLIELDEGDEITEYRDPASGSYRAAVFSRGRLAACVYLERDHWPYTSADLPLVFQKAVFGVADRLRVLSQILPEAERVVCACAQATDRGIRAAIRERGLDHDEALARVLGVGARCGLCLGEVHALLAHTKGARRDG